MAAAHELLVVETQDRVVRVQEVGMEYDLEDQCDQEREASSQSLILTLTRSLALLNNCTRLEKHGQHTAHNKPNSSLKLKHAAPDFVGMFLIVAILR